jgi:hypothetical protein
MSRTAHRRLKKIETPIKGWPLVRMVNGPSDMSYETAIALLKLPPLEDGPSFYFGILKPGERPRCGGITVSDEDWEQGKNYPRYVEPWPEYTARNVES